MRAFKRTIILDLQNKVRKSLHILFLCTCLIFLIVGCSSSGSSREPEPTVYNSLDEMLFDPQFSYTPADGILLEATVDIQDFVIGILYNPEPEFEFYQFFSAQIVEGGYVLDTLSEKISAKLDYGFLMDFFDGAYTVHFAIGEAELSDNDQFLDSKVLSNGKNIKIGLSPI